MSDIMNIIKRNIMYEMIFICWSSVWPICNISFKLKYDVSPPRHRWHWRWISLYFTMSTPWV